MVAQFAWSACNCARVDIRMQLFSHSLLFGFFGNLDSFVRVYLRSRFYASPRWNNGQNRTVFFGPAGTFLFADILQAEAEPLTVALNANDAHQQLLALQEQPGEYCRTRCHLLCGEHC